ncbi:MAG: hypothetical protein KJ593_03790 [Candidatus Omnitrophica bacterium]|nr:hypothetical protein [Candidatus Omnitrophota bacterium]
MMRLIKISIILNLAALLLVSSLGRCEEEWSVTRSRHFILYYHEDINKGFLSKAVSSAERYYDEITDRLGFKRYEYWLWDNRAKLYIYKDRESYIKATGMPSWSGGRAIYKDKIIESFPWSKGFFEYLLPHELGHIIFREFIGFDIVVPLWFEEGVACSQEDKRYQSKRRSQLYKALKASSLIPVTELNTIDVRQVTDEVRANLFYAQAESLVNFLLEKYGRYDFVRLCRLIRDYKDFEVALSKIFYRYKTLEDLDKDWRYYLNIKFDLE